MNIELKYKEMIIGKSGDLLLARRSERRYAERGVVISCEYNSIDFIESSFTKEPIAVSKDGKQFYINFQGDCVINCP